MSELLTESLDIKEEIETSRTYNDTGESISAAKIDGLEAVKAAILKRLSTEQYDCQIYSFDYGIQTEDLFGKDKGYVVLELKRRITECLLSDERITGVSGFSCCSSGDKLLMTFTVSTIFGTVNANKEV